LQFSFSELTNRRYLSLRSNLVTALYVYLKNPEIILKVALCSTFKIISGLFKALIGCIALKNKESHK